jgi:hypothetical protein
VKQFSERDCNNNSNNKTPFLTQLEKGFLAYGREKEDRAEKRRRGIL